MEEAKSKKKKNKKKKNNNNGQNKAMDEISQDQSQASTEIKDVESQGKESDDVCLTGNGSNAAILVESEKQQWLEKEATLVGTIDQLHEENNLHLHKECAYEETIKQLREENNFHIQKEANLEMKIGQLQRDKDSWVQKECQLEEKISQLLDEKITWNSKEDSNRVMISNMGEDIAALQAQVAELENIRNYLLNENRKLLENISSLQLQIKDIQSIASEQSFPEVTKLTSERDELSSQIESAFAFVERLMEENAELVEKVSELLILLDRHRGSYPPHPTLAPEPIIEAIETGGFSHPVAETNSIEIVTIREERNGVNYTGVDQFADESSKIMQIPLDENGVSDLELQVSERIGEEEATSFTDAPMIGAPFRLISFVSRYVSGADLVEKNPLKV